MFSFPNPVNEKAARVVAGVVMVVALITLLTSAYWLLVPLTYGFWARVLTGPTLSPLGQFATRGAATRRAEVRPRAAEALRSGDGRRVHDGGLDRRSRGRDDGDRRPARHARH